MRRVGSRFGAPEPGMGSDSPDALVIAVRQGRMPGQARRRASPVPEGSNHQVDGISGATMTGNGLNIFINRDISYYDKYFSRIRGT